MRSCEGERGLDPVYKPCSDVATTQVCGMTDKEGEPTMVVYFLCDWHASAYVDPNVTKAPIEGRKKYAS